MGFSKKPADNRAAESAAPASAAPVSEEPSSSSGSFFSRLSLPLRSRARNVADFHVRPAEPHRLYGAGDQVQGAVILTVVKPVRITHLVVSLHGFMRVYKNPNTPANEPVIDPADIPNTPSRTSRQKGNGHGFVRLFQDEQTLSGDGKLEPGRYEFNFNLLFPTDRLPSSIDFERGTISYMITATLTRPASIGTKTAPKTSCERKVYLVEQVDVGPLAPPRPRTIYLEPISKRPKRKKQPVLPAGKGPAAVETALPASDLDSTRANENSTEGSLSVIGEELEQEPTGGNARSPVPSDVRSISGDSAVSGSTGLSRPSDGTPALSVVASLGGKKFSPAKERTITATVELLKGGCLRGDVLPIKISVQHIKRIKSLHGVIVTLYRLGRIDSSPPLLTKDLVEEKEEYYPKSKTGLGGLSLSSAGTCSVFRKDLSQAFAPLIIDPATLTANLTTSIRVPTDAFSTIKDVPYDMISFKYHVEVIVDLGGKLANQIQAGKPSGRANPMGGPLGVTGGSYNADSTSLTSWGTSIIDTDRLRRQKGVICVVFEVIVGTTDSSRQRGKLTAKPDSAVVTVPVPDSETYYDGNRGEKQPWPTTPDRDEGYAPDDYNHHDYTPSPHGYPHEPPEPYRSWSPGPPHSPTAAPHYIPPPDVPDESSLTEKDRIRRAEQRLLPSQPAEPDSATAGPSSALHLHNGENIYDADDDNNHNHGGSAPEPLSQTYSNSERPLQHVQHSAPSAPTLDDLSAPHHHHHHPHHATEDKQELERRRLLAEASAPPDFPDDYYPHHASGSGSGSGGSGTHATTTRRPPMPSAPTAGGSEEAEFAPSAPVLDVVEGGVGEWRGEERYVGYGGNGFVVGGGSGGESSSRGVTARGGRGVDEEGEEEGQGSEPLPRYER